jgi:hypothetical protein
MPNTPEPDFEHLTDREWSMRADRHAREALKHAGDLNARYNDLVEDNRTLLSEIDKLSATIAALEEAMVLIADRVLK